MLNVIDQQISLTHLVKSNNDTVKIFVSITNTNKKVNVILTLIISIYV